LFQVHEKISGLGSEHVYIGLAKASSSEINKLF
jgi:hypothetical protein